MAARGRAISAACNFPGRWRTVLATAVLGSVLVHGVAACRKAVSEREFVGKWQSSRSFTPIYLAANGEWEIRKDDSTVLQYGLWRYDGKRIIWTMRQGSQLNDDVNPVVAVSPGEFRLTERDGTTTVFKRLP